MLNSKIKKVIVVLIAILLFCSCSEEEKAPYTGTLRGRVSYRGASNMEVGNVIITLRGIDDNTEKTSERIARTGEYSFDLPSGKYVLNLECNLCYSTNLPDTVEVRVGETTTKDINIEQLRSKMVILHKNIEKANGDTITLDNGEALDIWNKYGNNTLIWQINAYPSTWISFERDTGTIAGGRQRPVVFHIDKEKLPAYGFNTANIILTTDDNGSFTITIRAYKEGGEPEKASITGDNENVCPATSVILTANAVGAVSYKWYRENDLVFSGGNTYSAGISGIYYAVGVNSGGEGTKSEGKTITISSCSNLPAKPEISGAESNICPDASIILTTNVTGASSYRWYRNGIIISGASTNVYTVTTTGSYSVAGVNTHGTGVRSDEKSVTISACPAIPTRPTLSSSPSDGRNVCPSSSVTLTASNIGTAISFEWYKDGEFLTSTPVNTLPVTETGIYSVAGINSTGQKGTPSLTRNVVISSCIPDNPANVSAIMSDRGISLSWTAVSMATGYRIRICDNAEMNGCDRVVSPDNMPPSFYEIRGSMLYCGMNHFKVTAFNNLGESTGKMVSMNRVISVTAPSMLFISGGFLSWNRSSVRGVEATIYYDIYRRINEEDWIKIEEKITTTSYSSSYWSQFGETVSYRIRAYVITECGKFENWSGVEIDW